VPTIAILLFLRRVSRRSHLFYYAAICGTLNSLVLMCEAFCLARSVRLDAPVRKRLRFVHRAEFLDSLNPLLRVTIKRRCEQQEGVLRGTRNVALVIFFPFISLSN